MQQPLPRFLLAGTGSGCGKTTVTCAILSALVRRGLRVGAAKCGPDYIDPMFHSRITGAPCTSLDPFFFDENTMSLLLARAGEGRELCVIEGVMGYYDGLSPEKTTASTFETARMTKTPVILVLDARGASHSMLATLHGFLTFCPDSGIAGVIFNRCSAMLYPALQKAIRERFGDRVQPLGFLPPMQGCSLESRRLGLITAQEDTQLTEKLQLLAKQAQQTVDLDGLCQLARKAPPVCWEPVRLPRYRPVRIAIARDRAFCFYYEDNLRLLRELGAELIPFSPLSDAGLPENIDGLYLGGGYPELYTRELSENRSMLQSVHRVLKKGLPCIAECGGVMYLTESIAGYPMAGFLPGQCFDTKKLVRFGYVTLRAHTDNLLCRAGEEIRAHEFHYWDATNPGSGFFAEKPSGKRWDCAISTTLLYAGYPHLHFYANPRFAQNFYKACLKERETECSKQ